MAAITEQKRNGNLLAARLRLDITRMESRRAEMVKEVERIDGLTYHLKDPLEPLNTACTPQQ